VSHFKHVRVIAPLTVFLVVLTVLATAGTALAHANAVATALVTVSANPSPYKDCSNANQPGTNYLNAEVEPYVAVNPANSANIIGVWQQDRWSNGGAHGLVAGFSSNGGTTWDETTLPFSVCAPNAILDPFTGAPYNRASDPWVSIGPDGTAYAVGLLATNTTLSNAGINDTGVAAVTSTTGGQTWGNARLIKSDKGTSPVFEFTQFFNDKESVTADPHTAGTAYVVWDRLKAPSHSPDAALRAHAFRGPTWFSKTTDGGLNWTSARPIFDPGQNSQTIGNQVVVAPNGTLYDFFELFQTTGDPHFTPRGISVGLISSSDGGSTWSKPTIVSAQQTVDDFSTTGKLLRTGAGLPSVAIDANTGNLYVVWTDARFTGGTVNQVVISTSTDGGKIWSAPARVSTATGKPAFTTTVAVNSAGVVGVTYYDLRNPDGSIVGQPTDYWFTSSTDGVHFGNEARITPTSFDILNAPFAGGFFVGDYEGLGIGGTTGTTFVPFFVKTNDENTSNRTDVFTDSVTP
jgi:hypothetical protein